MKRERKSYINTRYFDMKKNLKDIYGKVLKTKEMKGVSYYEN